MAFGFILIGLVGLFIGGELLVRGSVAVARRLKMSELLIGLTLVGFGTSMPELVTTLQAAAIGEPGIAIGNVVGSNIANILLVLGLAAVISPIVTHPRALARDTMVMIAATAAFLILVYMDAFTRVTGGALVGALVVYLIVSVILDRGGKTPPGALHKQEAELVGAQYSLLVGLLIAIVGVAGVILGARFLVEGAVELATMIGLSSTVIGLSIVAVGTSLPELVTSVVASLRGKNDVALGNVIGSNIFNIAGIMGITALVKPFSVIAPQPAVALRTGEADATTPAGDILASTQQMADLPLLNLEHAAAMILSVALLVMFGITGSRLSRWEGGVLLAAYALYMGLIFEFIPTPFSGLTAFVQDNQIMLMAGGFVVIAAFLLLGLLGRKADGEAS